MVGGDVFAGNPVRQVVLYDAVYMYHHREVNILSSLKFMPASLNMTLNVSQSFLSIFDAIDATDLLGLYFPGTSPHL